MKLTPPPNLSDHLSTAIHRKLRKPVTHTTKNEWIVRAKVMEMQLTTCMGTLEQLAQCDLNDDNCATLENASRRVRGAAFRALAEAGYKIEDDT